MKDLVAVFYKCFTNVYLKNLKYSVKRACICTKSVKCDKSYLSAVPRYSATFTKYMHHCIQHLDIKNRAKKKN